MKFKLQFSLISIAKFIVFVAVGCTALVNATDWWARALYSIAVFSIVIFLLRIVYRRDEKRAFAVGFAICGSLYFLAVNVNQNPQPFLGQSSIHFRDRLITTKLSETAYFIVLPRVRTPPPQPTNFGGGVGGGGFFGGTFASQATDDNDPDAGEASIGAELSSDTPDGGGDSADIDGGEAVETEPGNDVTNNPGAGGFFPGVSGGGFGGPMVPGSGVGGPMLGAPMSFYPIYENFLNVSQALWTVLIAYLGGFAARYLYISGKHAEITADQLSQPIDRRGG